ncbi:hypothetical protein ACH5RR_018450 [Cinchona calisaya]|uniref:Uncharacterized protein n=1 Tax=Cinchona calisaya TaxID=153742 RepID=A0ABD2ZN57_9GENT
MFNQAISVMSSKLQVYKKYLFSNAKVRPILPMFQCDGIDTQWVISTDTVVEEFPDEQDEILPAEFNHIEFRDLAQYANSTTHSVAKVRPAKLRETVNYQRYALEYFFKEGEGEKSVKKLINEHSEHQSVFIQQNLSIAGQTPEQESSSSRVRVRLENKFDATEVHMKKLKNMNQMLMNQKSTRRESSFDPRISCVQYMKLHFINIFCLVVMFSVRMLTKNNNCAYVLGDRSHNSVYGTVFHVVMHD